MKKKKVLIIKIGAIGDVILSLPMLNRLKDYEITWLCGSLPFSILDATKRIDKIIVLDEKKLFKGVFFQKISEILKIWKKVGFRYFDKVIIAHSDFRYQIFTLFTFFGEKNKFSKKNNRPVPGRYFAKEYCCLANLKEEDDNIEFPELDFQEKSKVTDVFSNNKKVIAIIPGGAKNILRDENIRRWPIENYVILSKKLIDLGYKVILFGDKNDIWCEKYFEKLNVMSLIGKTSLLEAYSCFLKSDLVICHDCGPLHLANLAKVKILALFGPTNPRTVIGEGYNLNTCVVWGGEKMSCSPCFDGNKYHACLDKKCLCSINPKEVFEKACDILEEKCFLSGFTL